MNKNKLSQKDRIINKLLKYGEVSRNSALQNFISRLGAIICDLQQNDGWKFKTEYRKTEHGQDFYYITEFCPIKQQNYKHPITGQIITTYKR